MAITISSLLHEALLRVSTDTASLGRVSGMHIVHIERMSEDGITRLESVGAPTPTDFVGLAAALHPLDRAALKAALDALE